MEPDRCVHSVPGALIWPLNQVVFQIHTHYNSVRLELFWYMEQIGLLMTYGTRTAIKCIALGEAFSLLVIIHLLIKNYMLAWISSGLTFNWGTLLGWCAFKGSCNPSVYLHLYFSRITWTHIWYNPCPCPILWPPDVRNQLTGKKKQQQIKTWCWERLKAGDNREWDGWMASLTQWAWVCTNSGRWWRTGKPGML